MPRAPRFSSLPRRLGRTLGFCLLTGCWLIPGTSPAAEDGPVLSPEVTWLKPIAAGQTPEVRDLPEDLREIELSYPLDSVQAGKYFALEIERFDRPQRLPAGAFLEYDIYFAPESASVRGGFDLESEPRTELMLRNMNLRDGNGLHIHPANALNPARGKWYRRRFALNPLAGVPFQVVYLSGHPQEGELGVYSVRYRRLRIVDAAGRTYWSFYPSASAFSQDFRSNLAPQARLAVPERLAGRLSPSTYRLGPGENLEVDVDLQNLDYKQPRQFTGRLWLVPPTGEPVPAGAVESPVTLAPGADLARRFSVPASALALPAGQASRHFRLRFELVDARPFASFTSNWLTVSSLAPTYPAAAGADPARAFLWAVDASLGGIREKDLAEFRADGGNFVNLFIGWADLETAPQQYDFTRLDELITLARRLGLRLEPFLITCDTRYPAWYREESMLDAAGNPPPAGHFALSYWAPTARPAFMKMLAALVTRYRDEPVIASWQASYGGWLDAFFLNFAMKKAPPEIRQRPAQLLFDYSAYSQAQFRRYVREVLKYSLPAAARRYGLNLTDWEQLKQPVWQETEAGLDLRPIWWDFQNFRCWTVGQMWEEVCGVIRAADPDRPIEFLYGGSQEAVGQIANDYAVGVPICRRYGARFHNTCYESPASVAPFCGTLTEDFGVPHTFETAGTPAKLNGHQRAMFSLFKHRAQGYAWIDGNSYSGGAYPSFGPLRALAAELKSAREVGPRIGLIQSLSTNQCSLATSCSPDFNEAIGFLTGQGRPLALYSDRLFLFESPVLAVEKTPLVIDLGRPLLTEPAANEMLAYARSGGTLMLFPASGRLTPGRPEARCRLWHELGLPLTAPAEQTAAVQPGMGCGDLAGASLALSHSIKLPDLPAEARPLARFADGRIAAAEWPVGSGTVVLLNGFPVLTDPAGVAGFTKLLARYVPAPGVTATSGVWTAHLQQGRRQYVVLFNCRSETTVTRVGLSQPQGPARVVDLLNQRDLGRRSEAELRQGLEMQLKPYEVNVLALDDPDQPRREFPAEDFPLTLPADPGAAGQAEASSVRPSAWQVAGPFANPDGLKGASFYAPRWPETGAADPAASWRTCPAVSEQLDFKTLFGQTGNLLAYARAEFSAERAARIKLNLSADYGLLVYLNDRPIFDANQVPARGAPYRGEFCLEVPARAGLNTLLAKVAPGSDGWKLWCEFQAPPGLRLTFPEH